MRLLHYSTTEIVSIVSMRQPRRLDAELSGHLYGYKPLGFWVSVEGERDWKEFSIQAWGGVPNKEYEITLVDDPDILFIHNRRDLYAFAELFQLKDWNIPLRFIDWYEVSQHYGGIIISPYMWHGLDLEMIWYYSWDCASGCIWDHKQIANWRLICT